MPLTKIKIIAIFIGFLILLINTKIKSEEIVGVENSWIREPIIESDMHAGYFTLYNLTASILVLEEISSKSYKKIEIHEMKHVNGMMQMREIEELVIPANGKVTLAPRGMHLMLIKPNQEIKSGGQVDLKLKFKNGQTQSLVIPIRSKFTVKPEI